MGRSNLKDIRAAAAGLRDLRQRIAHRLGDKPKLTKARIKLLIEEGRSPYPEKSAIGSEGSPQHRKNQRLARRGS